MTLDMEAVKRRDARCFDHPLKVFYDKPERPDATKAYLFGTASEIDALLDRRDLIAEVERLKAKVEDQNERIAQLHRERGEAVAEVGRLKVELEGLAEANELLAVRVASARADADILKAWRPIDSAPKDGTDILCLCEDIGVRVLYWHVHYEAWALAGSDVSHYEPAYWMPTPPETR